MDEIREAMSDFNFVHNYSRYLKEEGRRETWGEACDRILNMHMKKYEHIPDAKKRIKKAMRLEKGKRILSSQRARQFGGQPVLNKNWRIYNCTASYCDRPAFFTEAFWLLLCGCGVGFSIQKHHIARLPQLETLDTWLGMGRRAHVVEDTIEGWADALGALLNSRFGLSSERPTFDYSRIRERGAPLGPGGKAPGSEPLSICLDRVETLLSTINTQMLSSVNCLDIIMFASDAVLSGGVRRAASIALFSPDDNDMVYAKTGEWWEDNPQRARCNISAVITDDVDRETYDNVFSATKQFGEPGFIFSKSREFVFNPCVEIGMAPVLITDELGDVVGTYTLDMLEDRSWYEGEGYTYESGWQACNLVEVNCSKFINEEDALAAVEAATILATAQAGYTDSGYLKSASQKIVEREALIGVSLTGMANCPDIAFNPEWQRKAAHVVKHTNLTFSATLGINPASRTTCIKPSGSAAVLLGCASGIHAEHSERYIRNIQASASNPVVQHFKKAMPDAVTESPWSSPGSQDFVISFPIKNSGDNIYRKDLSACVFLDLILNTQRDWVREGTNTWGVEALTHNVSNTVLVSESEWSAINSMLWDNRDKLTGVALLSTSGDYVYAHPPFQEVVIPEDIHPSDPYRDKKLQSYLLWERLREIWAPPNYMELEEMEDTTTFMSTVSCAGSTCEFKG